MEIEAVTCIARPPTPWLWTNVHWLVKPFDNSSYDVIRRYKPACLSCCLLHFDLYRYVALKKEQCVIWGILWRFISDCHDSTNIMHGIENIVAIHSYGKKSSKLNTKLIHFWTFSVEFNWKHDMLPGTVINTC